MSRSRRLTEQERDERRQADRDRLENAARELLSSEGWARWVSVRASNGLGRYSLRNQWLVAADCHRRGITPTYVAGFGHGSLSTGWCAKDAKPSTSLRRLPSSTPTRTVRRPAGSGSSSGRFPCSTS